MKNTLEKLKKDDFFKKANLHIHSTYSDGRVKFDELINEAESIGLEYYSITDHNTVEGYKKIEKMPNGLITGVEFDCFMDFNLPHILGYGIDVNSLDATGLTVPFKKGKTELFRRIFSSRNPKKVINAIHNAGGIAVLAHPCCYWCLNLDKFIKKLVECGLDGVEVYYPYDRLTRITKFHSRKTVIKIADKYNLIKTGGMDTHGSLK